MSLVPAGARHFWRLLRGARENPLVRAGAPWRQGIVPALFFWLQVVVAVAYVALMLLLGLVVAFLDPIYDLHIGELTFYISKFTFFHILALPLTIISFPINVLVFTSRWLAPSRLQDLYLTTMRREEVILGVFLWPLACGALLPLAHWLGAVAYLPAMCQPGLPYMSRHHFHWPLDVVFPFALLGLGLVFVLGAGWLALLSRLMLPNLRWLLPWVVLLLAACYLAAVMLVADLLMISIGFPIGEDGWYHVSPFTEFLFDVYHWRISTGYTTSASLTAFLVGTYILVREIAATSRYALTELYLPVRPDSLEDRIGESWRLLAFLFNVAPDSGGDHTRHRKHSKEWRAGALYLGVALPLLIFEESRTRSPILPLGYNLTASFALLAIVSAFVVLRIVAPGGSLRCLGGAPHSGLFRPLMGPSLAYVLAGVGAAPILHWTQNPQLAPWHVLLVFNGALAGVSAVVFLWALSLPGAWARRAVIAWPAALVLAWLVDMAMRDSTKLAFAEDYVTISKPVLYAGALLVILLFLFIRRIEQRFFERRVQGAALGEWRETRLP